MVASFGVCAEDYLPPGAGRARELPSPLRAATIPRDLQSIVRTPAHVLLRLPRAKVQPSTTPPMVEIWRFTFDWGAAV